MCVCLEGTHCTPNLHGPPEAPWATGQLPNSLTPYNSAVHPCWQLHAHTHTWVHPNLFPPSSQIWGPPAPKLIKSSITRRCLAKGKDPWISPHSSGGASNHQPPSTRGLWSPC